jgi:hypothetical protein
MAGRPRGDLDRWVVAGCRRAFEEDLRWTTSNSQRGIERLDALLAREGI